MAKDAIHNIVCQVKNQINPDDFPNPVTYKDYKNLEKIYLFCGRWTEEEALHKYEEKLKAVNEQGELKNHEIIKPEKLFSILQTNYRLFNNEYRYVDGTVNQEG